MVHEMASFDLVWLWYNLEMSKRIYSSPKRATGYTLGRTSFAKISAVEGIHTSRRTDEDFQDFDRRGLSADERRRELVSKYGSKR